MARKLAVGVVVLVVVLWLVLRGDESKPVARSSARPTAGMSKAVAGPSKVRTPTRSAWIDAAPDGALRLEGQVLGPDGAPVGGAEVALRTSPPRTTTTEADGSFAFDRLLGRVYQVAAASGALIGGPVTYRLTEHSDPLVLRLGESASAVVTVIDEARRPVAGAAVHVTFGMPAERVITTGADGTALLAPLYPGAVVVEVVAEGHAPAQGQLTLGSPGAKGALTVVLRRGVPVSGRVIDEAGAGIAGARVEVRSPTLTRLQTATVATDEAGEFTIPALASGVYTLRITDGEHAPLHSLPFGVSTTPVRGLTFTLFRGGVIAGRVVDVARQPVPFATVLAVGAGESQFSVSARNAFADGHGVFELRGLPRVALQLMAGGAAARSKPSLADLTDRAELQVELVLDDVETIAGRVIDTAGAPIADVQVTATPELTTGVAYDALSPARVNFATTRGDGTFVIPALSRGAYRVKASWRPELYARVGPSSEDSGTLAQAGDQQLVITLALPGALTGKVVLAGSATPPQRVTVTAFPGLPTMAVDGAFEIKDLQPGAYQLIVRSPEFAEIIQPRVEIKPGTTTELGTIVATRGRVLTGKVVDAAGAPVVDATVELGYLPSSDGMPAGMRPMMMALSSIESGPDGSFVIAGVPTTPSRVPLQVMASDPLRGSSAPIAVPIGSADPPPVTLRINGAPPAP